MSLPSDIADIFDEASALADHERDLWDAGLSVHQSTGIERLREWEASNHPLLAAAYKRRKDAKYRATYKARYNEKRRVDFLAYYAANKAAILEQRAAKYVANREVMAAKSRERMARKRAEARGTR